MRAAGLPGGRQVPEPLVRLVEKARREWLAAQDEFNFVTDPQLIDHAIFSIQAAERRYVYLLRLAAQACEGIARDEEGDSPPSPSP